jgi:hypothetical protein
MKENVATLKQLRKLMKKTKTRSNDVLGITMNSKCKTKCGRQCNHSQKMELQPFATGHSPRDYRRNNSSAAKTSAAPAVQASNTRACVRACGKWNESQIAILGR